jgi:hypothetical protein
MPTAVLLNPDDPLYNFENMMSHRQYFAVIRPLSEFSTLSYLLDPSWEMITPAAMWNLLHQQAHNDFNRTLPSNYANGYTLETVTPPPVTNPTPPPPTIQPPPYQQANPLTGGTFGIPQTQILIEGPGDNSGTRAWWTFANFEEHYIADQAILPLPTTAPVTAGTPPGVENVSNPWWWTKIAPVIYPFW